MKKFYYLLFHCRRVFVTISLIALFSVNLFAKVKEDSLNILPKNKETVKKSAMAMINSLSDFDTMEDLDLNVNAQVDDNRSKAQKTMAYLDQNPDKVKAFLSFEDLVTFPVGFKQKLPDNSEIMVGVYEVAFTSTGADVTFFIRYRTKIENQDSGGPSERDMLFGVNGVKFTKKGGLTGVLTAGLLGDFTLPGKNWTVVFKGGSTLVPDTLKTFIKFSCDKFQSIGVSADVVFPRNIVLPFDENSKKSKSGRFTLTGSVILDKGIRDMLLNINGGDNAFCSPKAETIGYKINNLVLDLSEFRQGAFVFPSGYQHPDVGTPLWKGLYIGGIEVLLPGEFEKSNTTKITATGLIIDKTGFTGKIAYSSSSGPEFSAQKWKFSMSNFGIEFLQNDFVTGGFGGKISTPINDDNEGFNYNALIFSNDTLGLDYSFAISTDANDVKIKCWKARGKIYAGSQLKMELKDTRFYPSCNLSGLLSIGSNGLNGTPSEGYEDDTTADVTFKGIEFIDLNFQTYGGFKFRIGGFKYLKSDSSKVAKVPVAITRLEMVPGASEGQVWIGFGFKISLLKDKFSGGADITLKSYYNPTNGKLSLGTSGNLKDAITISQIFISGTTPALSVIGKIDFFKGDIEYGKGFKGFLKVGIYKPFKVGVEAEAIFGKVTLNNKSIRYGYFSVYGGKPSPLSSSEGQDLKFDSTSTKISSSTLSGSGGIRIPTPLPDIFINGVGMGVYFNMKPVFNSDFPDKPKYIVNDTIPFGFKVMLGIENSTASFVGNLAVDISLSTTSGINSIGVFGRATISPKTGTVEKVGVGGLVKNQTVSNLTNSNSTGSTEDLISKGQKMEPIKSSDKSPQGIQISLGMLLDVSKRTAHAEAIVFVNQNGIVGIGPGNRAGRMVLHFEDNNTYIHLGKSPIPERVGLKFGDKFGFGAYLMIGRGITPFPYPPQEVMTFFPSIKGRIDAVNVNLNNQNSDGGGFALGANVSTKIDASGWLGSIYGYGAAGIDLMFTNTGACEKWVGAGMLYGLADVDAKLLGKKVFSGAIGFNLIAQGMRPFSASGDICLAYGRKKKKMCLGFSVNGTCN